VNLGRIQSVLSAGISVGRELVAGGAEALTDLGPARDRRVVWERAGHAAIEIRGLDGTVEDGAHSGAADSGDADPGGDDGDKRSRRRTVAEAARRAVQGLNGVRWAEVNEVTAQLLVAFDDERVGVDRLVAAVAGAEKLHGASDDGFSWDRPAHPADPAPLTATLTALAGDIVGVGLGLGVKAVGPLARTLPAHAAVRVPLALMDGYPWLRRQLEKQIGPLGTDMLLGVGNAAMYGLTEGPARPAVDAVYRVLLAAELRSRQDAWAARGPELTETAPRCTLRTPEVGERPAPFPDGPIESYTGQVGKGSLAAAAAVLAATRDPGRAAEAINATIPKAARLGREGFAAVLGWDLARSGVVPMDRSSFRRLDRVSVVVLETGVLKASDGELDPLAEAVLLAARGHDRRVLVTPDDALGDLIARADEVIDCEATSVTARIRELQAGGEGVLLVSTGDDAALHAADVGVGYLHAGPADGACWTADLICGPGLVEVWRLLRAAESARSVSQRSVTLAASGATMGLLLATVGRIGRGGAGQVSVPVSPVQAASLASLLQGAYEARRLGLAQPPKPAPRIAWHAMPVDEVLSRLAASREPAAGPGADTGAPPASGGAFGGAFDGAFDGAAGKALGGAASLASAVLAELRDPLTPVLLIGSAASALLGGAVDAALVGGVMLGNAVVGGAQRMRTEQALESLLVHEQQSARLVHGDADDHLPADPEELPADMVPAANLRPGDRIWLRANDVVPADARLLAAEALEADESTLTGESLPVTKDPAPVPPDTPLAERPSMVYEGTTVVSGTALAVVVATGEATEAGRATAAAGGTSGRAIGVSAQLADLTNAALPASVAGGLAVTALGMLRGVPLREALASGVAVGVAAVPEGLPLVATVAQLAAARRLSQHGVLVRSPRTLEALGRVDVVCFDKTGTLTQGRLEVAGVADMNDPVDFDSAEGQELLRVAARACPAGRVTHATDQAILDTVPSSADDGWEIVDEMPFENRRGLSASLGRLDGRPLLAVKGAPEVVLDDCASVVTRDGGDPEPLTAERRKSAQATIDRLAADGLRVLAIAQRNVDDASGAAAADLVGDLTLLGFVAIADKMRPEATEVIRELADSGVRPVMITGDHPATASAIARRAGLPNADRVITGAELDGLAERDRREHVTGRTVFARISPEQKVRIVADLQRAGQVVAMVGDGTNDAAAIRLADVGIGVRARGSTAARNASDLVLVEADIGRIRDALTEGRALWRSIRDAVSILVGGNAGEITFMVIGTALGGRSPLNTRQLLLVNMLTDMFPALAVAGTRAQGGNGTAPAQTKASLLHGPIVQDLLVRGGATALGATLAWSGGRLTGRSSRAATMGLAAVVTTQLAQTLLTGTRSPAVVITCAASVAALVLVVNTPGVSQFFGCTPLGPVAWAIVLGSSVAATAAAVAAPRVINALNSDTA
jgi:cation-transporting ATPase I